VSAHSFPVVNVNQDAERAMGPADDGQHRRAGLNVYDHLLTYFVSVGYGRFRPYLSASLRLCGVLAISLSAFKVLIFKDIIFTV